MRQRESTIPVLIWALTAFHVALLLLGSVLQPLFRVPDEPFHADMVRAVADDSGWPAPQERILSNEIEIASRLLREIPHLEQEAIPRKDDPAKADDEACTGLPLPDCSFRPELQVFSDWDVSTRVNRMTQHPPLYYVVVSASEQAIHSLIPPSYEISFDSQLWLERLVTLILVAPLPLLIFLLARVVTEDSTIQVASAAMVLWIPAIQVRNGAMINNDNLLLLLGSLFLIPLLMIATGRLSWPLSLVAGATLGLALLTKGLALVLVPLLALAYVVGHRRDPVENARRRALHLLTGLGIAFLIGGWWWLRNIVVFGELLPAGLSLPDAGSSFRPDALDWLLDASSNSMRTFFGDHFLGGPSTQPVLFWGLFGLFGVGVVAGLAVKRRGRGLNWLLIAPLITLVFLVAYNSYGNYTRTGLVKGVNGRYFFFLVSGLMVVLAAGYVELAELVNRRWQSLRGVKRYLPAAIVVSALGLQGASLVGMLASEWGPADASIVDRWDALVAWAPIEGPYLVATFLIVLLSALFALVMALRWSADSGSVDLPSQRMVDRDAG